MKRRICISVSSEYTIITLLIEQIQALSQKYHVTIMANTHRYELLKSRLDILDQDIEILNNGIYREVHLTHDLMTLIRLILEFRRRKFYVVHSMTPKAGLLSMLAAIVARVPVRIHTFTGQVWATKSGYRRMILKAADKVTATFATHILIDSPSQRIFLIEQGVVPAHKSHVLAHGSVSGVDTERFIPNPEMRITVRQQLSIPHDAIAFIFIGRLNEDKGILDLAHAFVQLCATSNDVYLLIVGPDEQNMIPQIGALTEDYSDRVNIIGRTDTPESYLAASDVLCLPSYREGFGTAIIEAASVGLPAIASRIYGVTDAVEEDVTGLFFQAGNIQMLLEKMQLFVQDRYLSHRLGTKARERASEHFSKEQLTKALIGFYNAIPGM